MLYHSVSEYYLPQSFDEDSRLGGDGFVHVLMYGPWPFGLDCRIKVLAICYLESERPWGDYAEQRGILLVQVLDNAERIGYNDACPLPVTDEWDRVPRAPITSSLHRVG